MASASTRRDSNSDILYAYFRDRNGRLRQRSTGIKISAFGERKAHRLALQKAIGWENKERESRITRDDTNLNDLINQIESLKEADKLRIAVLLSNYIPNDLSKKINDSESVVTYKEVRDEFRVNVKNKRSKNWLSKEKSNNQKFIDHLTNIGISKIVDIIPKHVNSFIKYWETEGRAPNTITDYLKHIKQVFDYAVDNDMIEKNPVSKAIAPGTKVRSEHIHIDNEYLVKVFELAKAGEYSKPSDVKFGESDLIFWTWLRYTGLNPVDVSSLKSNIIRNDAGGRYIDGKRTKTGVAARIPLHDKLEEMISKYGKKVFGLYPKPKQRQYSTRRFRELLLKASNGKVKTTLASLRHTFATDLFNSGYSCDEIKMITGHVDTKLLGKVYVKHVDQVRASEAINKVR